MRAPTRRPTLRHAGLLLLLMVGACSAPPERSTDDINSGRFDLTLAHMYLDGNNVPHDDTKSAYLLSSASALGDIDAEELLGRLYAEGRGIPRDDALATSLFRVAVDGGNVPALNDLGRMIETGRGTAADPESALDFYARGMAAGDAAARENYQRLKKSLEAPPPQAPIAPSQPQVTSGPAQSPA